jgi:hypothetical protein
MAARAGAATAVAGRPDEGLAGMVPPPVGE